MNVRLFPGMVVVREDYMAATRHYSHIVVPELGTEKERARARTSHVGTVLAMGPPARTGDGVEVPHGFAVGDRVVFHFEHHERSWTRTWPLDGEPATWVPQQAVDGVVEA